MAPEPATPSPVLVLPQAIVGQVDIIRATRELEALGDMLSQQKRGGTAVQLPPISERLAAVIEANKVDIQNQTERQRLYDFLGELKTKAPRLHMSFASEPAGLFTEKIITWLRTEIHPLLLLDIGLQPTIAAGCVIRTSSKIIDCSIRQRLVNSTPDLLKRLRGDFHA